MTRRMADGDGVERMLAPIKRRIRRWQRNGRHRLLVSVIFFMRLRLRDLWHLACYPFARRQLEKHKECTDIDRLVPLICRPLMSTIRPVQVQSELIEFMHLVSEHRPRRILEIGTGHGGTLFLLSRAASEDALIVSVDLPGGWFGGGYRRWQVDLFESFALKGQRIELLRKDSHDIGTFEAARAAFGDAEPDLLFIDGDHTYDGVRRDFEMYGPLVRSGGLIAMHDIAPHPEGAGGEVHRFWAELKDGLDVREFVEAPGRGYGIGVIRKR